MIKLAIDAMGGDFAPQIVIEAALSALLAKTDLHLFLYGDKDKIQNNIQQLNDKYPFIPRDRITILHTSFFLKMDIQNIREELKNNPNYSMFLALKAVQENQVDGLVTAGPTQALVLASYLMLKKIKGIKRIALAPFYNNLNGDPKILLDAGANIMLKPEYLLDFAIYATSVSQVLFKIQKPIVKLLNIGIEPNKGRIFETTVYKLLKNDSRIFFQGNEESQNILTTNADILLGDGFTCNMILKSYKGAIQNTMIACKNILTGSLLTKIVTKIFFHKKFKILKDKLDSQKVGGAMILGLNEIVLKAHGNSNVYAFFRAILQARILIKKNFLPKISQNLQQYKN